MRSRGRIIALVLALLGAFAIALSLQAPWWTAGEVAMGPFGSRHCFGDECRETGLSWIPEATDLWMRSSVALRAGGYITMFILIVVAGALAARRVPRLMARAALVALLTAIASGGYFAFAFPGLGGSALGYGLVLFVVAIALGVAAAITTLRLPEPSRPS